MEFSFSDRRWLLSDELERPGVDRSFALGLHIPGTFSKVIDVQACLLQEKRGNDILQAVKRYARESGLAPYGIKSHQGYWRFLTLRHSKAFGHWMVNLVTSEERSDVLNPLATALGKDIGHIHTVVNNLSRRKASVAVGEREVILTGEGFMRDTLGPFTFHISPNSFFQTNAETAERMYRKVVDYADLRPGDTVLDLYSGTGTIPIFIADRARQVFGIELVESAVKDAERNCRLNGIENCRFLRGDIRDQLRHLPQRPDIVIIDPPRAGMHGDVVAYLRTLRPGRVVYVSCNPATFARDVGLMIQDYELVRTQPLDMFPHTYHIELVAELRLRKRGALAPEASPGVGIPDSTKND
jgi:23S rRNA (uracil1939-C5)-methyltransferase